MGFFYFWLHKEHRLVCLILFGEIPGVGSRYFESCGTFRTMALPLIIVFLVSLPNGRELSSEICRCIVKT